MSGSLDARIMRILQSMLISGLTDDVDAVYDKAMSGGLVGDRSVAPGKKDRARDLVTAIICRVETDTISDPSPMEMFMAILRSQCNLEYLAQKIETERGIDIN